MRSGPSAFLGVVIDESNTVGHNGVVKMSPLVFEQLADILQKGNGLL
jgi:hypothetical protein